MENKIGRPPLPAGEAKGRVFQMRLTDAERQAYEEAAERAEVTLSAWIRQCLNKAAKKPKKC